MRLAELKTEIKKLRNPKKAKVLQGFFKTKKGQYGAGDIFYGIILPLQRKLVNEFWKDLDLKDLDKLIKSKVHEERLIALLILVKQYQSFAGIPLLTKEGVGEVKFGITTKQKIFKFYISHTKYINNWDLVDLSAPNIVGEYLISLSIKNILSKPKPKSKTTIISSIPLLTKEGVGEVLLSKLALSKNLWERRIAILATLAFIKRGISQDTLKIAKILLNDDHDLIHKAVGWMLREVGKRCNEKTLTNFLNQNVSQMPRTMLRYAIERLPEKTRKYYLSYKYAPNTKTRT